MHPTYIIKKPLITEKSTWESASRGGYSFQVDMRATKPQISQAIASIYGVTVAKVNTQIRKGGSSRTRHGMTRAQDWKKATVFLEGDDRIELF